MFVDRFLASTFSYNIETVLLFNKIDQIEKEEKKELNNFISIYNKAGYDCMEISGKKNINIDKLKKIMIRNHVFFRVIVE